MIQKNKLIGYTILCASMVLYGFCIWAVLNQTNDSQSYAPVHQSAHYGQSSDAPLLGTTPKQLMSASRSKTHTTPNYNSAHTHSAHTQKMAHPSAAPFTYRSSDAQTQHIGSGYGANNDGLWSNSQSNGSSQRGIHATTTWNGQVSAVASRTLAYVEAPSGSLPGELFAPQVRRAPPDEEDDGTNGPNIEQETPIGDGLYILLLLIMLYFCRNMLYVRKN
jgi:hypothetical protein